MCWNGLKLSADKRLRRFCKFCNGRKWLNLVIIERLFLPIERGLIFTWKWAKLRENFRDISAKIVLENYRVVMFFRSGTLTVKQGHKRCADQNKLGLWKWTYIGKQGPFNCVKFRPKWIQKLRKFLAENWWKWSATKFVWELVQNWSINGQMELKFFQIMGWKWSAIGKRNV
jgi:hypothetical protein